MKGSILSVRDLTVTFRIRGHSRGWLTAVNNVSVDLGPNEILGVVGESGSGKTSLIRAIMRLVRPSAGSVHFEGVDFLSMRGRKLVAARRKIQMVFQDPSSSLDPRLNILDAVAEPLKVQHIGDRRSRRATAAELLDSVGLPEEFHDRYPHQLSGGQRQRVGIARVLALSPAVVIADEPVSALDVSIQAQILNLLLRLQRERGLSMIVVAHDLAAVNHISDRIAVMYLGRIIEIGPTDDVIARSRHPYTKALVAAVPDPDPVVDGASDVLILSGEIPAPEDPPSGCAFHPRCWMRRFVDDPDRCAASEPALREIEPGHQIACHFPETITTVTITSSPLGEVRP